MMYMLWGESKYCEDYVRSKINGSIGFMIQKVTDSYFREIQSILCVQIEFGWFSQSDSHKKQVEKLYI